MKVILLQDVANIGRRFSVVEVSKGYALNKLIPIKLAEPATPANTKRLEAQQARLEAERTAANESFDDVVKRISNSKQTVIVEANEQGHLFKGLKANEIAKELNEIGFAVNANQVVIEAPIKAVGEHLVTLSDGEKKTTFTIVVNAK